MLGALGVAPGGDAEQFTDYIDYCIMRKMLRK